MIKFQVGDLVRVVNNLNVELELSVGAVHKVFDVRPLEDGRSGQLVSLAGMYTASPYLSGRFELYQPPPRKHEQTCFGFPGCDGCAEPDDVFVWKDGRVVEKKPTPRNPKDLLGESKPDLSLIPPAAMLHEAMAMELGARKYGLYNFRVTPVEARTYVAAAMRHITAWLDGEEYCSDTLLGEPIDADQAGMVHNLGAAKAGLGILLDCLERKTLVDNRPPKGNASEVQERMKRAKEQRAKEAAK